MLDLFSLFCQILESLQLHMFNEFHCIQSKDHSKHSLNCFKLLAPLSYNEQLCPCMWISSPLKVFCLIKIRQYIFQPTPFKVFQFLFHLSMFFVFIQFLFSTLSISLSLFNYVSHVLSIFVFVLSVFGCRLKINSFNFSSDQQVRSIMHLTDLKCFFLFFRLSVTLFYRFVKHFFYNYIINFLHSTFFLLKHQQLKV